MAHHLLSIPPIARLALWKKCLRIAVTMGALFAIWFVGIMLLTKVMTLPVTMPIARPDFYALVWWGPLWEEAFFRGVLWATIDGLMTKGFKSGEFLTTKRARVALVCAVTTGALFAVLHTVYWSHPYTTAYLLWSTTLLTYCRWKTGTWLASLLLHMAMNASTCL